MTNMEKVFNNVRRNVSKYFRMIAIMMAIIVLAACNKKANNPTQETVTPTTTESPTTEAPTTEAETIAKVTTIKEYVESSIEEGNLKGSLMVLAWNEKTGTPIAKAMCKWSEEDEKFMLTEELPKIQLGEDVRIVFAKEDEISGITYHGHSVEEKQELIEKNVFYGKYVVLKFKDFFGEKLLELAVDEYEVSLLLEGSLEESIAEESTSATQESKSSYVGEIPTGVSYEDFCDSDYVKSTIPKKATAIILWYPNSGTGKVLVGGETVYLKELEGDARFVFFSKFGQYDYKGVSNEDIISKSISLGLSILDTEFVLNSSKITEKTNLIFEYKTLAGESSIEITLVP